MTKPGSGIHIGTSGWSYKHWKGTFYDERAGPEDLLATYARHFMTVEVNNTFYHLPERATLETWRDAVPDDFVFAIKASRYITHFKKLHDARGPISQLLDRVEVLDGKLGPILFQCPPNWHMNLNRLRAFLQELPRGHRYAFEFRDPSWFDREVYDLLAEHQAAFCIYDLEGDVAPKVTTADLVYVRLHKPKGDGKWRYDRETLADWVRAFASWADAGHVVCCYFNNDPDGAAPDNAEEMLQLLQECRRPAR